MSGNADKLSHRLDCLLSGAGSDQPHSWRSADPPDWCGGGSEAAGLRVRSRHADRSMVGEVVHMDLAGRV